MTVDADRAYANTDFIPGGAAYPSRWAAQAAAFRLAAAARLTPGIAYGRHPRQALDLLRPQGAARGLMVFLHGGYWMAFDRAGWTHLAAGALAGGWAVAMPSYRLAPQVGLADVLADAAAAVIHAASLVAGPVVLCGHSAGGQLAARLSCDDAPLPPAMAARLERVVAISVLGDLRPLQATAMAPVLRLDDATAAAQSPILHRPRAGIAVRLWVGADERPAFVAQSRALAAAWNAPLTAEPGRHHFDVIDGLADPAHPLTAAVTGA